MKQFILALMLAITVGVVFLVDSGLTTSSGADCLRVDNPAEQIP